MDDYGQTEFNVEHPLLPFQRHHFGLQNELMEILWHDGEAFLQSQTLRKPREHVPWDDGNTFNCLELLSGIQTCNLIEPNKLPDVEEEAFRLLNFSPIRLPVAEEPPAEAADSDREQDFVTDSSVMTMELSSSPIGNEMNKSSFGNCSNAVPAEMDDNSSKKVSTPNNCVEQESTGGDHASLGGGSASNDNKRNKRKIRNEEKSESPSEDSQTESPSGKNQSPLKSLRRSRVPEVHNLSERRRRDRINEKMRALQKLIPHSHKSDKASMLDDAIDYMKSLQSQLQWWMGNGMAQTRMLQQFYYPGSGIRAPALPSMQNFMYFSKVPMFGQAMKMPLPPMPPMAHDFVVNPFSYQNQMQMPNMQNPELYFVPGAQPMKVVNFSSQANQVPANGKNQMNQ